MKSNSPIVLIIIVVIAAAIFTVEKNDGEVTNPFEKDSATEYSNDYYYPEDSRNDTNENATETKDIDTKQESPYSRYISLGAYRKSQYSSAPGDEKITISLSRSAPAPINITGWQIWSVATGNRGTIGQGIRTVHQNNNNVVQDIILNPGQKATIHSGASPFEYSFIPNMCMSYLKDTRNFPRGLPSRCPDPRDKAFPLPFFDTKNECRDYIESMSSCEVPYRDSDFTERLGNDCRTYIKEITGYDNCVRLWQNDEDFYENEWWVFLGKPSRMYSDRGEEILLFDEKGVLVDSY